jgi:hypothetical protein
MRPNIFTSRVDLGPRKDDIISGLIQDAFKADADRAPWLERQAALTRLRFGQRKPKTFPWPGASNLEIPLIDSQIRRYKPLLMRLVVEADPAVEFVGEREADVEKERTAEAEYSWLFKTHMNAVEPLAYVIDSLCHRGLAIAQIGWDYRTELDCRLIESSQIPVPEDGSPVTEESIIAFLVAQYELDPSDPPIAKSLYSAAKDILAGKVATKITYRTTVADRPAVWDREPATVIVPARCTDIANAEWVCIQHIMSARQLRAKAADGHFSQSAVTSILADVASRRPDETNASTSLSQDRAQADERERIWGAETVDTILLWEFLHWTDSDIPERCITWVHPSSKTDLVTLPFPFPFRRWPVIVFNFEKTSRRFYSPRGISAMLEPLQREMSAQHNARVDGMTLRNAPAYQIPSHQAFKAAAFQIYPGAVIRTPPGTQIQPLTQDRGSFPESVNEETSLRQIGETYIGNFDNAVMAAGGSRRTATEIQAAVQLAASTASFDAILFQLSMRDLHLMVWDLWMEYRPNEVSYKVHGIDPDQPEKLVTIKKADIAGHYALVPTGTIANTNRALELSSAREALSFFAPDQTGFVNKLELFRWYLSLLDYRRARKILNTPDQASELQTLRQAAAELQQDPGLATSMGVTPQREDVPIDQPPPLSPEEPTI